MKMIEAINLTKCYRKFQAVDHLNFEVEKGEILGFLGPNGAGKTTTIKILNTLIAPTSGIARVNGFDVTKNKMDVRRSIGLVPQDFTLDRDMTGLENLVIQSRLYDVPQAIARTKIQELLKLVDLEKAAQREVSTYSGGMQKRLELAMGLVHTPKVLFLDEPTLGLDAQSRLSIWSYIKKLNQDFHVTIFLTTHYLEEADELCNRIIIIDGGKIMVEGTPQELKDSLGGEVVELGLSRQLDEEELNRLLKPLPGVLKVWVNDKKCYAATTDSESLIPKLILSLAKNAIETRNVSVTKASLNQVFLKHIVPRSDSQEDEDEMKLLLRERMIKERS
ncbi:MAG: ATP-binding cassette domain-containing protein [Nitrososphaerota archaeon]|nr:ATP-binding cassette domain-containing protein [Nitrososphaerota archaeon]